MSETNRRIRVDWLRCEGRGLCAELLPERIDLDDWGYPVVTGDVNPTETRLARRAVNACPTLALSLEATPAAAPVTVSSTVLPSRPARGRRGRR